MYGRGAPTQSVGDMRMDMADYGRDSKKEEAMCAYGCCTSSHGLKQGPDGYRGRYGGHMLCKKHYEKVLDSLLGSLRQHDCAPWEDAHPSNQDDDSNKLEDLFQ